MKYIVYFIPDINFFKSTYGGKISHALGIIDGLCDQNKSLKIVCGEQNSILDKKGDFSVHNIKLPQFLKKLPILFVNLLYIHMALIKIKDLDYEYVLVRKNAYMLVYYYLTFGLFFTDVKNKEIIWEVNGLSLEGVKDKGLIGRAAYYLSLLFNKIMLKNSLGVYVVSKQIRNEISKGVFKCDETHVKIIENGSPKVLSRSFEACTSELEEIHLIFFGVFRPYNNFQFLISAVEKVNEIHGISCHLHFIGYGPCEDEVNIAAKRSKKINYWGKMNREDLLNLDFISKRVYGVIPMKRNFGSSFLSPIKLYEYASLGFPVVISDAFLEPVDTESVFFYQSDSHESFLTSLMEAVSGDYLDLMHKSLEFAKKNSWSSRMFDLDEFASNRAL